MHKIFFPLPEGKIILYGTTFIRSWVLPIFLIVRARLLYKKHADVFLAQSFYNLLKNIQKQKKLVKYQMKLYFIFATILICTPIHSMSGNLKDIWDNIEKHEARMLAAVNHIIEAKSDPNVPIPGGANYFYLYYGHASRIIESTFPASC